MSGSGGVVEDGRFSVRLGDSDWTPLAGPFIEIGLERVDRSHLVVDMTLHRHAFPLLPPLHRRDVPVQVRGDFLPRVQTIVWGALACC